MKPYVGTVSIKVKDLDRAKAFFADNFGWVCTADVTNGDYRWVSVSPSENGQTNLHLSKEDGAGELTNVMIECDDVVKTAEALKAKGVEISEQPRVESWGGWAKFKDSEGNEFGLHHAAR
jgi:predicted enzyme related to lactoylglutathione lyase